MEFSTNILTAAAVEAPNMIFVAVMGICTVLLGLTCIIFLCTVMSKICARFSGAPETAPAPAPAVQAAPQPAAAPAPAAAVIPNRGELVAAVSAALAEELGTDISRIRIHSLRPVGAAAPAADPARGELVAAIAAAAAEELGTDVSRIRIHSLRKIG